MAFEHVALDVADPPATAKWWSENLGYRITRAGGGPTFVTFIADPSGTSAIELYRALDAAQAPDYCQRRTLELHLALRSDDVEADIVRLVAAGATLVEVKRGATGITAMLRDPAGIAFQLVNRQKSVLR